MDCTITVKGNGVGRYGHPKHDRTGPIREFLVDNQIFYRVVKNHVATCDKCDPNAILEHYLARRLDPKTWRTKKKPNTPVPVFPVSEGLAHLALQYDRLFGTRLHTGLVRKFLLLSVSNHFMKVMPVWTAEDMLDRAKKYDAAFVKDWQAEKLVKDLAKILHPNAVLLARLLRLEPGLIQAADTIEDAEKLFLTMEVMNT